MKKIQLLFVALSLSFVVNAQKETVLTIDGDPISKSEFEYVFKKNNANTTVTKAELDEYMELFINYKLKVKEAEDLGMDTLAAFKKELNGYRDQLAAPYLTDTEIDNELITQAYERLQVEIRASHILIKVDENASPQDTLTAYTKMKDIKGDIQSNEISFEDAALRYSEDPSVKTNKGDLGYFTAFQMVYPFENAAYDTPVGEVSVIVRTRFGYHILKINDRRPSRGELKVAHIVIISNDNMKPAEQAQAKEKIDEIYAKVEAGSDFGLMAKQFSDDKGSASRGGELPMFGPGKMVPEFEDQAYALKNVGDISAPFKSRFGWHIIKLLEVKKVESFDDMKVTIVKKIERDSRSQKSKEAFIKELDKEYGVKEYPKNLAPFYGWVDSTIFINAWEIAPSWSMNKALFTIAKTKVTQKEFADYLLLQMRRTKTANRSFQSIESYVNSNYAAFKDYTIIEYEKAHLEDKYPNFKSLMQEYHDGILLFELSDKKVWKRATSDTLGLDAYYEAYKMDNMWPERVECDIYKSINDKVAKTVYEMVEAGISNDSILPFVNVDSQLNLLIENGIFSKDENEIFSKAKWEVGISDIFPINNQYVFVNVKDILLPSPKSLDEAKGYYISNYQEELEKEWIRSLRSKYSTVINKDVLYSIATE